MNEETFTKPASASQVQSRRFRAGALIVLVLVTALILWLVVRDDGGSSDSSAAKAVSADEIEKLAASVDHPVYWVGPRDGYTYELRRQSNGTIIIRYLPAGVEVGDKKPHLSVATYPFAGAFPAVQKAARKSGSDSFKIPEGGLAEFATRYPQSIHVAYPKTSYQIEVYDPKRGAAAAMLKSGQLTAFGASGARAASLADLKALSRSVGHPVYWVGPRSQSNFELIRGSGGKIIIRYLPRGVAIGSPRPYLSVATYPFPGALRALQASAKQANQETIELQGGGIAVLDRSYPKSIHLAYPGSDYQVEVFDPSPAQVRKLVSTGQVSTIG
jgi:hypothetical protein